MKHLKSFYEEYEYIPKPEDHLGSEQTIEDVVGMGVPNVLVEMMKEWPIIWKSPYSDSMYNTDEISWTYKPDGTLRVSDHWNFSTRSKKHCITKTKVPNKTHWAIGKYDRKNGNYDILKVEETERHTQTLTNKAEYKKFMMNPNILAAKKKFKQDVANGDISVKLVTKKGETIEGILQKYTGREIRIKQHNGDIYTDHHLRAKKVHRMTINIELTNNKTDEKLIDPFSGKFEKQFEHLETFNNFRI
jgi:hypothetical protein